MGFGDWLSNAASNTWSGIKSAGSAVASLGDAQTWKNAGNAIAGAASATVDGIGKAASWTYDNALKPAGNVIATVATYPFSAESREKVHSAVGTAAKGVADYATFVYEHPQMALRQAGQGLSDTVTGLVGFVGDVAWYGVKATGAGIANVGLGIANLGSAPGGERLYDYVGVGKFSVCQDWLEEKTGSWLGFSRVELDELAATGEIRRDTGRKDANGEAIFDVVYRDTNFTAQDAAFAAGTKYATRAVGEVVAFAAVTAATAGIGGAALASVRGGNLGLRAAQAGNFLARGGRLGEMAAQPLYWLGRDVSITRGLSYLDDAAKLRTAIAAGEKVPEIGLVGRFARLPGVRVAEPVIKFYDPGQTASAFANLAGATRSGSIGYGLRAAEGTFNFLNPFKVNGTVFGVRPFSSPWNKAALAWSIEGGGAALSYHSNSSKENELAAMGAGLRQYEQEQGEALANEYLQRNGLDPNAPAGAAPPATPEAAPPPSITPGFQDNAQRDSEVTHEFNIKNGLVQQPTDLTLPPPAALPPPAQDGQVAPPYIGNNNNNRPR